MRTTGVALLLVLLALAAAGCESVPEDPEAAEATDGTSAGASPATSAPVGPAPRRTKAVRVDRVLDGDTLDLRNGRRVRLVQIDAPERSGECYGAQAGEALRRLLPPGTRVVLQADPSLDRVDRYGRLLRYVFEGRTNVNLALVRRGAASVWFYDGDRGRYAGRFLTAARNARASGRGAWGACRARLDPSRGFETRAKARPQPAASGPARTCHSSYVGACLDPFASDYDCAGGEGNGPEYTGFVRVVGPDDYELDRDQDGRACEAS